MDTVTLSIQLINKRAFALFDHLVLEHGQRADLWVTLLEAGRARFFIWFAILLGQNIIRCAMLYHQRRG